MEHTLDTFLELVDTFENKSCCSGIRIGQYEGKTFAIFEGWEQVEGFCAFINGFEGLKGSKPYLREGETLHGKYTEACQLVEANPDNWNYKRAKETALSHFLYSQYLASNKIDPIGLDDFEDLDWGFSDEYDVCCHCGTEVIRTSPDSYSWTPPLFVDCEGYVCPTCAPEFTDYVKDSYKNEAKSIPDDFSTEDMGLVKVNSESFENGLYGGQCDEPKPIIEALNNEDIDVWFKVYPGQFDVSFDVYVESDNLERAINILNGTDTKAAEDPAILMERGLRAASAQMSNLQGDGIKYSKINADGTASTRLVSQEEFIKGIKD